ncbi:4Fe-4S binding protein [Motiliproteus sp. MSK22-1]|uniref:4Fe-4S binding protein n=1 Tax=Motiliproteus sp. MSK22-1 TaxID=1897630 RepID=UPI0009780557|nr:4Fe-4S binding protein [Motiliproteus sp. MSK22-1]OMH25559.1 4Fe-4S binding protein [Motiliproteus sp. MSK22-1]
MLARSHARLITRTSFFLLFLLAPTLDIFRLDLTIGNFIIFGQHWTLGMEAFQRFGGESTEIASNLLLRTFLPVTLFILIAALIVWRLGRVYCGWLCPHFSVVEMINQLMLKHLNRVTLWERASKKTNGLLPWLIVAVFSISMAFVWAFSLLTYLLPPKLLFHDLIHFQMGLKSSIFLTLATLVFTIDFMFARHLFCKFGCALGVFQSLLWMGNKKALVVSFDKSRASLCKGCDRECDKACPMRLHTRSIKRAKFTCTQCSQCLSACDRVQKDNPDGAVIRWVTGDQAQLVDRNAAGERD